MCPFWPKVKDRDLAAFRTKASGPSQRLNVHRQFSSLVWCWLFQSNMLLFSSASTASLSEGCGTWVAGLYGEGCKMGQQVRSSQRTWPLPSLLPFTPCWYGRSLLHLLAQKTFATLLWNYLLVGWSSLLSPEWLESGVQSYPSMELQCQIYSKASWCLVSD